MIRTTGLCYSDQPAALNSILGLFMVPVPGKFSHIYQLESPLSEAFFETWDAKIASRGERVGLSPDAARRAAHECWSAVVFCARNDGSRVSLDPSEGSWLASVRQDLSLEGISRLLLQLDHTLREALWKLGLSAPDWQALVAWQASFFEFTMDELVTWGRINHGHQVQLRDEVAFFRRLSRLLETSSDPRDALNAVVKETARVLNCEFSAVLLPSESERGVLHIAAVEAPPLLAGATRGMTFPLGGTGIVAQAYLTGAPASSAHPIVDLDLTLRRRQTLEGLGFSDMLAYPLSLHGTVVGVLCLASRTHDRPWQAYEDDWLAAIATQLALAVKVLESRKILQDAQSEANTWIETMLGLADPLLRERGKWVGQVSRIIGQRLGLGESYCHGLEQAGKLHDIGHVFLPDALRRRPSSLWPEELEMLQQTPERGAAWVENISVLRHLGPAIRHHHERWDGVGYPSGLKGDEIPLAARILAVASAFVTATALPMREPALTADAVRGRLELESGLKYDPVVVQALFSDPVTVPHTVTEEQEFSENPTAEGFFPDLTSLAGRLISTIHRMAALSFSGGFPPVFWTTLQELCPHDAAILWERDDSGLMTLSEVRGLPADLRGTRAQAESLEIYAALCRVPAGTMDVAGDPRFMAPNWLTAKELSAAVAFPLLTVDRVIGVLTLYRRSRAPFSGAELTLGELAATVAAQALAPLLESTRSQGGAR